MCVVRFFLFGFNCTPCGTCCVSVRCCALTMNVNITVLAMENGKAVPQIGSMNRTGGVMLSQITMFVQSATHLDYYVNCVNLCIST